METARVRLGVVPYLNVEPLIWALKDGGCLPEGAGFELVPDVPSSLAGQLRRGEVAAALAPVFECIAWPGYLIVPDVSISTRRTVSSVRLFSDVPLRDIDRLALDASSLTSVNLTRVLFAESGQRVEFVSEGEPAPARLLIGDPALRALGRYRFEFDLGELWHDLTRLPFVFAAWLVHPDHATGELANVLLDAKKIGCENLSAVAEQVAGRFGFEPAFALDYFTRNLCYDLGPEHAAGMGEFWRLCHKHGLAAPPREFRFLEPTPPEHAAEATGLPPGA